MPFRDSKPAKKRKVHVSFDEEKRREYLTGFSKRKQARRRFGHDMEAFKRKKRQIEVRKQKKKEKDELIAKHLRDDDDDVVMSSDTLDTHTPQPCPTPVVDAVVEYDDEHTKQKFGDSVTVTTVVGALASESESESEDDDESEEDEDEHVLSDVKDDGGKTNDTIRSTTPRELTLFQRVQFNRKNKALPTRRQTIRNGKQAAAHFGRQQNPKQQNKKQNKRNHAGKRNKN